MSQVFGGSDSMDSINNGSGHCTNINRGSSCDVINDAKNCSVINNRNICKETNNWLGNCSDLLMLVVSLKMNLLNKVYKNN